MHIDSRRENATDTTSFTNVSQEEYEWAPRAPSLACMHALT